VFIKATELIQKGKLKREAEAGAQDEWLALEEWPYWMFKNVINVSSAVLEVLSETHCANQAVQVGIGFNSIREKI